METRRNPKDGLWYVIGYMGRNGAGRAQWMPIGEGHHTKAAARRYRAHLSAAERSAKAELAGNLNQGF